MLLARPFLAKPSLGATRQTKESLARGQAGQDGSNRRPELRQANATLWAKAEGDLHPDSAASAGKHLAGIAAHFGAWSVSNNKWTGPLETKAAEWPATGWSVAETTRGRDGHEPSARCVVSRSARQG